MFAWEPCDGLKGKSNQEKENPVKSPVNPFLSCRPENIRRQGKT